MEGQCTVNSLSYLRELLVAPPEDDGVAVVVVGEAALEAEALVGAQHQLERHFVVDPLLEGPGAGHVAGTMWKGRVEACLWLKVPYPLSST